MATEQINHKIKVIFARCHVRPGKGEEAFYLAVDRVAKKSKRDARRLRQLGSLWERTAKREFFCGGTQS